MDLVKVVKQRVKKLLLGSMVQIEPTRRCNFACAHCTHKNNEGNLDLDVYREIIRRHQDCRLVKLQGLGEPLLHPEIRKMVDTARENGQEVMIITNGSMPHIENVNHYVFSLETMRPEVFEAIGKRNHQRVIENIRHAASKQKVIINCVQCFNNTPQDVAEVKAFAEELQADIWITPQEVWVDSLHPEYAEQVENTLRAWQIHGISADYKKYRVCNWGVSEFYYDYTGAPHPCCIRMTDEYRGELPCVDVCGRCPL